MPCAIYFLASFLSGLGKYGLCSLFPCNVYFGEVDAVN